MPQVPFVSVVDDDRFNRASMRRLVTSLGYTVEDFASAADFLASPRRAETACLIADVQMPTMTGVELYRHLVDVGHAIPTILVTGRPDDGERARALGDGVVCYLGKPINEEHLVRCLHSALQAGEPQDENS
jgi:FixJ family two-component response regulator